MKINLETKQIDDIFVVAFDGEINGRNAAAVQEQLLPLATPERRVLLDMSGITYLSSAGLRTLLILYRQIDENNGCIALANLPEMIQDMMSMTGFLDFFTAYPTEAEGLTALGACDGSQ